MLRNITDSCKVLLMFIISFCLLLLAIPVVIVLLPFSLWLSRRNDKAYHQFLQTLNGAGVLVYTSNKKRREFIDQKVLPHIVPNLHLVLLDGRSVCTELDSKHIRKLLYAQPRTGRMPLLIRISAGQATTTSLRDTLDKAMQANDPRILADVINTALTPA